MMNKAMELQTTFTERYANRRRDTSSAMPAFALSCLLTALSGDVLAHGDAVHGHTINPPPPLVDDTITEPANTTNADAEDDADASVYGRWSGVVTWPVLAVHAALLPNGRVMAWDATPDDFDDDVHTTDNFTTRVTVWDPKTGLHLETPNDTNADLFCAGSAHLWDGRVLFSGGDSGREGRNGPLSNTSLYNPWTNLWTQTDSMSAPRWYSSVAALSNGELLTFGGTYSPDPIAEVFQFNRQWRDLPLRTPFTVSGDYSWLQATSSGEVMYLGPHNNLSTIATKAEGHWNMGPKRDDEKYRGYGSYAMFDIDKALVVGGGDSTASSVVVDMKNQKTTPTSSMDIGRRQHNLTLLADGGVLATGGNSSGATLLDLDNAVLTPEVWYPDTGKWEQLADMAVTRQYHSTALLLPDGRVLSAGGGYCAICGEEGYHAQNAEIFSPPYLFNDDGSLATRPSLDNVPEQINYSTSFFVKTDEQTTIERAHLIKLGSATHSQNQDQRLIPVKVQQRGISLRITSPARREIAPPGHYMLFVINEDGTPSTGEIILIGQPLIEADEVVVNQVREDHWDYYAIQGTGDHALTVYLQGSLENVDLMLNAGSYPTLASAGQKQFSCASNTEQSGGKLCFVQGSGDTIWYIGVYGREQSDYSLVASLDDAADLKGLPVLKPSDKSPPPPTNVRAEIYDATSVDLYWDAPESTTKGTDVNTILNYEVFRDGRLIAVESTTRHSATRLQPEKRYVYQIIAVDVQQNRSAATPPYPIMTLADPTPDLDAQFNPELPTAPTNVRIIQYSSTAMEVFWEPSLDNGFIVGYEIYRDGVLLDFKDGVSYYDRSLQPAEKYTYSIVAVDNEDHRSPPSFSTDIELPFTLRPSDPISFANTDTVDTTELPAEDFFTGAAETTEVAETIEETVAVETEEATETTEAEATSDEPAVTKKKKSGGASSSGFIALLMLLFLARRVEACRQIRKSHIGA